MCKAMALMAGVCLAVMNVFGGLPRIENADLTVQRASADFERRFHDLVRDGKASHWIAYDIPLVPGQGVFCCDDRFKSGPCHLERWRGNLSIHDNENGISPNSITLFFRAASGKVTDISMFSETCAIDGEGTQITYIEGVDPVDSIALLSNMVEADLKGDGRDLGERALGALALHRDPSVDDIMAGYLDPSLSSDFRKKVVFWLAQARGRFGFEQLRDLARNESDIELRSHVTFGLYISKENGARDLLIKMARQDQHLRVRGQALFWLAQSGGEDARRVILERLNEADSSDEMEKAVFALSQLPDGQGKSDLMKQAREHQREDVREKALFWLAQMGGADVVELIHERLENDASSDVREKAVFALSQLKGVDTADELIAVINGNYESKVRSQAVFWLGQAGGEKAAEKLLALVSDDESREVREKAVFAISQLPGKASSTHLMELVRSHPDNGIRKKALFWLSQSNDPEAMKTLDSVLFDQDE